MPAQSSQTSPPRMRTSNFRRRLSYGQPDLRVSDAERSEVADRLAEHYGDGRLDEAEFNERVDQAMRAKTRSDLAGLLDDLPDSEPSETAPTSASIVAARRRGHSRHPLLLAALIVVAAVGVGNALPLFDAWRATLIVGLILAVLFLLRGHDHRR
jgi:uncharacterized protein DUF1707